MTWKLILAIASLWTATVFVAWSVYYIWNEWLATGDDVKRYRNSWDREDL